MCHTLKSVDLSNNEVEEEDNISFLASLTMLTYINISNNPIGSKDDYLPTLRKYLSHVDKIETDNNEFLRSNN